MNEQDQLQFDNLKREVETLKQLFYKDNYSNLEVFRKQVQFKADVDFNNINTITETGGTAPIADGSHAKVIPDEGATITIVTKNGIITAIT